MELRETLRRNPAITTGATVLIIAIAVSFIIYSQVGGGIPKPPSSAFYTTDDGSTWFADDIKKVPPFQKDGKDAYRVHVFKCGSGKPFVAYMERYTVEAKKMIEQINSVDKRGPQGKEMTKMMHQSMVAMRQTTMTGIEYKKPGDSKWVNQASFQAFSKIVNVNCPQTGEIPERIMPK